MTTDPYLCHKWPRIHICVTNDHGSISVSQMTTDPYLCHKWPRIHICVTNDHGSISVSQMTTDPYLCHKWPRIHICVTNDHGSISVSQMTTDPYLCHKWPRIHICVTNDHGSICSICRYHYPFLSSFMTYRLNKSNKTGVTCGVGTAYSSRAYEFTQSVPHSWPRPITGFVTIRWTCHSSYLSSLKIGFFATHSFSIETYIESIEKAVIGTFEWNVTCSRCSQLPIKHPPCKL